MKKAIGDAMSFGAVKYGRYNYLCGGFTISRLLASAFRHLDAFQGGEDLDPESGLSHLAHAAANIQMLLDTIETGTIEDDRYKFHKSDNK